MPDSTASSARRWWAVLAAVVAGIVLVIGGVIVRPNWLFTRPTATGSPPTTSRSPSDSRTPNGPVSATRTGKQAGSFRLRGAGQDALYVETATEIVRIDLATGTITQTQSEPMIADSNFVAGQGWAIWKEVHAVAGSPNPGVLVRDGEPAEPLPPPLNTGGRIYLADPDHLWWLHDQLPQGGGRFDHYAELTDLQGRPAGPKIAVPEGLDPIPDPAGLLLTTTIAGVYQLSPAGTSKVTTGTLVAVGKHQLLVWDCDPHAQCGPYLVDRNTEHRSPLAAAASKALRTIYPAAQLSQQAEPADWNLISPDGKSVVLVAQAGGQGPVRIHVLNLATGDISQLPGTLTNFDANAQYAWTANSHWLIAITDNTLNAYQPATSTIRTLTGLNQPALHLAIANQPGN